MVFRYWEKPLKELQVQRKEQFKGKKGSEMELIVIPDDDESKGMTLAELEAKSLEEASKGNILVESDYVLDDGYDDGAGETAEAPKPVEPETASLTPVPKPDESESTSPTIGSGDNRKAELIEQLSVVINHTVSIKYVLYLLFDFHLFIVAFLLPPCNLRPALIPALGC